MPLDRAGPDRRRPSRRITASKTPCPAYLPPVALQAAQVITLSTVSEFSRALDRLRERSVPAEQRLIAARHRKLPVRQPPCIAVRAMPQRPSLPKTDGQVSGREAVCRQAFRITHPVGSGLIPIPVVERRSLRCNHHVQMFANSDPVPSALNRSRSSSVRGSPPVGREITLLCWVSSR